MVSLRLDQKRAKLRRKDAQELEEKPPQTKNATINAAGMLGSNVAPMWHQCCPDVAPMGPQGGTNVTPMLPLWDPNVATKRWEYCCPVLPQCCPNADPLLLQSGPLLPNVAPLRPQRCPNAAQGGKQKRILSLPGPNKEFGGSLRRSSVKIGTIQREKLGATKLADDAVSKVVQAHRVACGGTAGRPRVLRAEVSRAPRVYRRCQPAWEALLGSVARNCWAEARKNCEKRAKLRTGQRPKASKAQSWATPKSEQSSEAGNAQKRAKLRSGQRPKASQAQKWAMPKLRNELPCNRSKPGKPRSFNMTRKNTPLKTNIINAVETRRATFGPHWGNIGATLAQHWGNIEEH